MHASRIIQGLLRTQCPFIHAKRRDCLARVAAAASGGLGVVKLGKALGGPTGLRHRIKCCDRLLSNPHLAHERIAIYQAMAHRLLSRLQQVCIVVDWSELRENGSLQLLRAALVVKGRAVTLYEEVHPQKQLTSPQVHRQFMQTLRQILPAQCQPIIITDAGFRATWFQMLDHQGWRWIGRIRNRDMVCPASGEWVGCKTYYPLATAKVRNLGDFRYARSNPVNCRLVLVQRAPKGRHLLNKHGKRCQSTNSKKNRVAQSEPWLLAISPQLASLAAAEVIRLYAGRMQIEQTFRDLKNAQWGLGLRTSQTRTQARMAVLSLLATLFTFAMWHIGLALRKSNYAITYGSAKKAATTLSILSLALYWLHQSEPPKIMADQLDSALQELITMIVGYEK